MYNWLNTSSVQSSGQGRVHDGVSMFEYINAITYIVLGKRGILVSLNKEKPYRIDRVLILSFFKYAVMGACLIM